DQPSLTRPTQPKRHQPMTTPHPTTSELHGPPGALVLIAGAGIATAILLLQRLLTEHPVATIAGALAIAATAATLGLTTARLRDRHARASDPQGPGDRKSV